MSTIQDLNTTSANAAAVTLAPPTLVSNSDSGVIGDNITKATRPVFAGQLTAAEAGYIVTLYDGATKVGSGVVQASGGWSIPSATLTEGQHAMSLTLTDKSGNVAATSAAQPLEIRTHVDSPSAPVLLPSVDSGLSDSDHITNVNFLSFSGTAAAGAVVTLWDGATSVGRGVADASGKWVVENVLLDDGRHSLTAVAVDIADNSSAPSAALPLTIDTEAPLVLSLQLAAGSDTGAPADGVTGIAAPTVTGATEAGAVVLLFDGATQVGSAVADAQGNWSAATTTLADGAHVLSVRITDIAGNVSTAIGQLSVTIDTHTPGAPGAPVLAPQSDSGASDTDHVTNVAAPLLSGSAEAGAIVTLFDGASQVGSAVAGADGAWRITSATLADGVHSLTVTATDAAGNVSAASAALQVTIDTAAPVAPGKPDLLAGSDSGASDGDDITNATRPVIAGGAEAGARVALYDGDTLVGNATADAAGNWRITVDQALGNGVHQLRAQATDLAGNVSPRSEALVITIDTTAAVAPSDLDLVAGSDSGASQTDNLTNVATPTITGKAETGARVALFDGDTKVGDAVADADGVWRITTGTLADGAHQLTASSSSLTGTVSAPSAALVVTIDTGAPSAPAAPVLAPPSDSGASDADHVTNVAAPQLSGSAEAGAIITLFDGASQVGSAVAGADGAWRITSATLADGVHSLTVTATDAAGNVSAASAALQVTIDTVAPAAPGKPDLLAGSDSGASDSDDITNATRPVIGGSAEAGARVALFDGDTLVGNATADAAGNWRIGVDAPLADGVHQLRAQATDLAGNVSPRSEALSITIDTRAPVAPSGLDLIAADDSGASNSDNITSAAAPTITGKAEAGASVTLFDGATKAGAGVADANGDWRITTGPLADGVHHLSASTSALTGVVSPSSAALVVTIDTASPAAPGAPRLVPVSDSGPSGADGVTNVATPQLGGSAEAGAVIALFDGALQVATTVADAAGNWSITDHGFADGAHQLTVRATDAAGNVSAASAALALTIDTTAPAAPGKPDLLAGSDSGVSDSDDITNIALPTLAGRAEANAVVALYDGAALLGTTTADANGDWRFTVAQPLADGVHSLAVKATDLAGNSSAASAALSVRIDTSTLATPSAPDLAAASDSGASSSDNLTNVAAPLLTGTAAANATVKIYDGLTVVATTTANASGAWSVNTVGLSDGAHHLSAGAVDVAGNASPLSAALVVTVDTAAPAVGAPLLHALSDSGRSDSDGVTNDSTPTITGSAKAGATVKLYDGATEVGAAVANADGAWSITAGALAAGAHSLTAKATDIAGNVSAASAALPLTIDTGAPAAPAALDLLAGSDSGGSSTDNITNVKLPTIAGKAEANALVALYAGATLVGSGLADAGGNWQITLTQPLSEGANSLTAKATDVAGNASPASAALSITIDTTPLAAPSAPDLAAASDKGVSATDNITNVAAPTLTGTAPAGAIVQLFDGETLVGAATATSAGAWSIVSAALADGAHHLTARTVDAVGNVSAPSGELLVTIDTAAPAAPAAPLLAAASDSGHSNSDGITNDNTPTVTGVAEAGATVKLFDGATQVGTATANADGAWSITTGTLAAGAHSLTATVTDIAGNVGAASPALAITVDTSAAAPTGLDLLAESDSGVSNTDNVTSVKLPTIAGKAEANASVSLYDGAALIGTTLADANGDWRITVAAPLADGAHSLTAKATDMAGNLSAASGAVSVIVDSTPLAAPSAPDLAAASDKGVSATDNITNVAVPTLTGTAPAGALVQLFDGETLVGAATATSAGAWSIVSATLADGAHQLTARTVDPAGNVSAPSAALLVTIDTAAPAAQAAPLLAAASDTGGSATDGITSDQTPTLTGTAEAGATVKLYDGTTLLGSAVANADGAWSITSIVLAAGAHSLSATATDIAGNVGAASPALALTIDFIGNPPTGLDLVAESDSGLSNTDNITGVTQPTIAGKAEANASVSLYDGATLIGTALADAAGDWRITVAAPLADGAHSLTATATDVAGNLSSKSAALSITVDTVALAAPAALDLATASDKGASSSDNITNVATPTITGTAAANATVTLYDGDVKVGTALANASGVWSIASAKLADGAHHLTATSADAAGNISPRSAELVVTIDTVAPTASAAPLLDPLSDNGRSNSDGVTNDATPTVTGTAEAGATVTLFDGATQVGAAVANTDGAWSITASALAAGAHSLTVKTTDIAGNISAASAALTLTVDLTAPAAPTLDLPAASDSGSSSVDNLTNIALPTIVGKAEANASVALYDGAALIGTALADAAGNWQVAVTQTLADGVHSLTAKATDVAGNVSVASTLLSVTVDTTPLATPSAPDLLAASDKGGSNTDNLTNLATPTLTGTAPAGAIVQLFDGETLVGAATASSAGAWSIVSAALAHGAHHLTARTVDPAGNVSAPSAELVVTIDTAAPATPAAPLLAAASDSGRSDGDGVTNDTTPTLSGVTEAGATVKLFDGATQVGTAVAGADGAWSITTSALAAGAHSLTATVTDIAGNVGAASPALAITVDTSAAAPTGLDLVAESDSGLSSTDNITSVTQPAIAGKAEANASVSLYDGATLIGTALADAAGNWRITVAAPLADGAHSLTATATDVAGNLSPTSAALSITVDTVALAAPAALDLATASDKGVSSSDNITNVATPTITGTAAANATVNLYDDHDVKVGTALANASGVWSIASAKLADGEHHLTARTADPAGNLSAPSAELVVTIDTVAPAAPAAPLLAAASDSGRSDSDRVTNDTTPTVTGTAEAGATVTLFDGATQVGAAVANADGAWSITASALAAGVHSLTVKATDVAGNIGAASPALAITIDVTAPAAPTALDLVAASDSGVSGTDNITNVALPTIAGKAEANASIALYDGATLVGTGLTDASGNWQVAVTQPLADGAHSLTVQATDVAGNISVKSAALAVTIDTTAPAAPAALDLIAASDRGVSNSDNITNLATPTITGTAAAGVTVNLYDGETKIGSAVTAANGVWSITPAVALGNAVHQLSARATDAAGNLSAASDALKVTIDTATSPVSAPDLAAASDAGASSTDNVTNVATPLFTGTAEAGATVTLFDGTVQIGSALADGDGVWSIVSAKLADGVHSLTTKASDVAGNSVVGGALSVTIDTAAPVPTDRNTAANMANAGAARDSLVGVTVTGAGTGGSYVLTSNPGGLFAIDKTSGVITMPDSVLLTAGAHDVTVQTTDLAGNVGSAVFTIVGNTAPTISAIANVTAYEDSYSKALSFTVGDAETAPGALTLSATSSNGAIPISFSFAGTGADRTVKLMPVGESGGTTTITVTVKDAGGLTSSTTFVATVIAVDDQSTPYSDIVGGTEFPGQSSASIASLLANDTDVDSARPTSITSVSNISGGAARISGGNIVFTAGGDAHGLGHYQYTVADGGVGDVWVKLNPVSMDGDYAHEIQQMYVGYFDRPADKAGLAGKLALMANMSITDPQSQAAALTAMGVEFTQSPEYAATWGGLSDEAAVRKVYLNLFGRGEAGSGAANGTVLQSEVDLWVARLAGGTDLTRASLVWTMAQSAQNSDIQTTLNKTLVANYFTEQMTAQQNASYINGASTVVKNYLNGVTWNNDTVITAAENTATTIIQATGVAKVSGGAAMGAMTATPGEADQLMLARALDGAAHAGAFDATVYGHAGAGHIDLGDVHAVTLVGVGESAA